MTFIMRTGMCNGGMCMAVHMHVRRIRAINGHAHSCMPAAMFDQADESKAMSGMLKQHMQAKV